MMTNSIACGYRQLPAGRVDGPPPSIDLLQLDTEPDRPLLQGPPSLRADGRRASRPWPLPLTVVAELLGLSTAAPYKAAARWGLRNWMCAQVRDQLTRGSNHCADLDLERTIRFNASAMAVRTEFVLARRADHRAAVLDAVVLARVLGLRNLPDGTSFGSAWVTFVDCLADDLVDAANGVQANDVRWAIAERYLDGAVAPRVKVLGRSGAAPGVPFARQHSATVPLNLLSGHRRLRKILDGLGSPDPTIVAQTLASWDVQRMLGNRWALGDTDWRQRQDDAAFAAEF